MSREETMISSCAELAEAKATERRVYLHGDHRGTVELGSSPPLNIGRLPCHKVR
jgi:hypothetical protein